jgi:hypothetical protein
MKLKIAVAAGLLAGTFSVGAQAQDMSFVARVAPTVGLYQLDSSATFTLEQSSNPDEVPNGTSVSGGSDDSWENAVGIQTGLSAAMGNFFGDIAIDYLKVDDDAVDNRTDILLTVGYLIGDHWQAFGGYRRGMQGDSAFNDDTFDESGFFVGGGIGGIAMGSFVVGASAAYNFSKVDAGADDLDYDGISLKVSGSLASMPQHSLQLRYQTFELEDVSETFADDFTGDGQLDTVRADIELSENFLTLSYVYSFGF